ncbi:MAG: hypothetical protein JWP74_1844 [Marmoricola sp.]|nr:hypothetical protein [Marmoricola sp.]
MGRVKTTDLPMDGLAEMIVPVTADAIWAVLTDVTRVGEWSHEARRARWTSGDRVAVGSVFRGANRVGWVRWSRPCTVIEVVENEVFAFRTDGGIYGDSTRWTFRLMPEGAGTRIVETYRIEAMPRWMKRLVLLALPGHQDRQSALVEDLRRLGEVAAAAQTG